MLYIVKLDQFTAAPIIRILLSISIALLLLLKSYPNSKISLESIDDISFENNGTSLELIQTKHKTNCIASLYNASTDHNMNFGNHYDLVCLIDGIQNFINNLIN